MCRVRFYPSFSMRAEIVAMVAQMDFCFTLAHSRRADKHARHDPDHPQHSMASTATLNMCIALHWETSDLHGGVAGGAAVRARSVTQGTVGLHNCITTTCRVSRADIHQIFVCLTALQQSRSAECQRGGVPKLAWSAEFRKDDETMPQTAAAFTPCMNAERHHNG
jgi:hypothetical protein